jgi:tRNA uridine 5-carboxymethylaminomethyl modification enzyme
MKSSLGSSPISTGVRLSELLRRPEITYKALEPIDTTRPTLLRAVRQSAEIKVKYEGYIKRELAEVERAAKLESRLLPEDIDYGKILGLRLEAIEKLEKIRPKSIGQASRISGVNPADVGVLLIYLGQA